MKVYSLTPIHRTQAAYSMHSLSAAAFCLLVQSETYTPLRPHTLYSSLSISDNKAAGPSLDPLATTRDP